MRWLRGQSKSLRQALRFLSLIALVLLQGATALSSERFGGEHKGFSYSLISGTGVFTGTKGQFATINFGADLRSDDLFDSPRSLTFEYAEHIGKVSLASGLTFTTVTVSDDLKSALGLTATDDLSLHYLDVPLTYRVNAFKPGHSLWNLNAGVSLVMMLDISVSSDSIFESTSDASGVGGAAANKHVDFGFGFGGEFGLERGIGRGVYLTALAGFQRPFTGVTRASAGFARFGLRWYQP